MKECRCNKCTCTAVVERPDYMSVCDKCHEDCYYFGLGNIRSIEKELQMTHDELLEAVKDNPTTLAVVELHKPEEDESFLVCSMCMDGDYTDGTHAYSLYPCETIEAIEKELR